MVQQLRVSGREMELREFVARYPAHRRTVNRLRLVRQPAATVKAQMDGLLGIGVRDGFDEFKHLNLATKFLAQFAAEALLEGFARFTFATRKFPEPAEVRIRVALGDEQFAVSEDQAGSHFDGIRGSGFGVWGWSPTFAHENSKLQTRN
jgi:hypothetical protein